MNNKPIWMCVLTMSLAVVFLIGYAVTFGLFPALYETGLKRFRSGIDCMQRLIK